MKNRCRLLGQHLKLSCHCGSFAWISTLGPLALSYFHVKLLPTKFFQSTLALNPHETRQATLCEGLGQHLMGRYSQRSTAGLAQIGTCLPSRFPKLAHKVTIIVEVH